jgi:tRNA threonylcarbamoyladenosine biosynthesis protein TsaB
VNLAGNVRILAIDAATEACSAALWTSSGVIVRYEEAGRDAALRILPLVDEVLAQAGVRLTELTALAAGIGPGAFTGVRISVAVAQGLAFGAGLPVLGINSLEALAWAALQRWPEQAEALACLDARMGELYWGRYGRDASRGVTALAGPGLDTPSALSAEVRARAPLAIGRGMRLLLPLAPWAGEVDADALPQAHHLAQLASLRLACGESQDAAMLQPLYLRDKVALTEEERRAATAALAMARHVTQP